jgi:hypothetical protein
MVYGSYRMVNTSGSPIGITVAISVTGQTLQVVSGTVPANGSLTIPFACRYAALSAGATTVNVTGTSDGAGVIIGVNDCHTVIERTTV